MKTSFPLLFLSTLLLIKLVHADWLVTGLCDGGQYVLGADVVPGDCSIMAPGTYNYIQCTEDSYKMWYCTGDNCEEWAKNNQPVDSGPLNVCQDGYVSFCIKPPFNETALAMKIFPTAPRLAMLYTFPQWLSDPTCNGTLQRITFFELNKCYKPKDENYFLAARCNGGTFLNGEYTDDKCEKAAPGGTFKIPREQCFDGCG